MPESPWYLVRKDRLEDAKRSLRRLHNDMTEEQLAGQLAMLVHTINIEAQVESGATYIECFKGVNLRRTEIACIAFAGQVLSGSTFAYVYLPIVGPCRVKTRADMSSLMFQVLAYIFFRERGDELNKGLPTQRRQHGYRICRNHPVLVLDHRPWASDHLRFRARHPLRSADHHRHH